MRKQTLTEFEKKWRTCKKCPLHKGAHRHVLFRDDLSGKTPIDILFIGEAPGKTEDKLGVPFVGRSGHLLDQMLDDIRLSSYCITNVVCCIPWKDSARNDIRPPSHEEALACSPHIDELLTLTKPKLIAFLGKEAEAHFTLPAKSPVIVPTVSLRHPAYILRQGGVTSLEYKRTLHKLSEALDSVGVKHKRPPILRTTPQVTRG